MELLLICLMLPISEDSICMEQGHVCTKKPAVVHLATELWIEDYEDSSVAYHHNPSYVLYRCERCGKMIQEPVMEEPLRWVIWRREEKDRKTPHENKILIYEKGEYKIPTD